MAAGFGWNYNRSIFFFILLAFAAVFMSSMVVSGEDSRRSLKVDVDDYTNPLPNPAHDPKISPSPPKDAMRSEKVDVIDYTDPEPHPSTQWNTPPPSTTKVTVRSQADVIGYIDPQLHPGPLLPPSGFLNRSRQTHCVRRLFSSLP